jgi:hypothetical protein
MTLNEEEAKTKWCPFSMDAAYVSKSEMLSVSVNRDSANHFGVENVNCIGANCMAWKWHYSVPHLGYCGLTR